MEEQNKKQEKNIVFVKGTKPKVTTKTTTIISEPVMKTRGRGRPPKNKTK